MSSLTYCIEDILIFFGVLNVPTNPLSDDHTEDEIRALQVSNEIVIFENIVDCVAYILQMVFLMRIKVIMNQKLDEVQNNLKDELLEQLSDAYT